MNLQREHTHVPMLVLKLSFIMCYCCTQFLNSVTDNVLCIKTYIFSHLEALVEVQNDPVFAPYNIFESVWDRIDVLQTNTAYTVWLWKICISSKKATNCKVDFVDKKWALLVKCGRKQTFWGNEGGQLLPSPSQKLQRFHDLYRSVSAECVCNHILLIDTSINIVTINTNHHNSPLEGLFH